MKKFREGANVVVMFWIFHFVERENASEDIRSFVETRGKRGCSVNDEPSAGGGTGRFRDLG